LIISALVEGSGSAIWESDFALASGCEIWESNFALASVVLGILGWEDFVGLRLAKKGGWFLAVSLAIKLVMLSLSACGGASGIVFGGKTFHLLMAGFV
jgi:hypothetical protein